MTEKELNRCLPCRLCGEKPIVDSIGYLGCPRGKKVGKEYCCRVWDRTSENQRKKWNRLQKLSTPVRVWTKGLSLSEFSDLEREKALRAREVKLLSELLGAKTAHAFRLGNLYEEKKKQVQKLKEENDKLKAALIRLQEEYNYLRDK